jgi:hypothetical protein
MEGERETSFHLFPFSPQQILLKPSIFSFDLKVLLYHGSRPLPTHSLPFPWLVNFDHACQCNKSSTHSLPNWFWLKISFPFLEIMASHMATSYGPQIAQVNEESPPESSLVLIRNIFMMKILNLKRCTLVLKLNPLEPGTIVLLRTFTPW